MLPAPPALPASSVEAPQPSKSAEQSAGYHFVAITVPLSNWAKARDKRQYTPKIGARALLDFRRFC